MCENSGQFFIAMSDIFGCEEMADACKMMVLALSRLRAEKRMRARKLPAGPFAVQIFPSYIMHSMLIMFVDPSLFEHKRKNTLNKSSCT